MQSELIDRGSDKLIIFLTGWGCDANQFRFMKPTDYDILVCYDYSEPELNFDFSQYKKFYLIAFSAGVFMAGVLQNILPEFEKTVAINGNPLAYDEYFGLRKEIVDIFMGVTKENALDFRRKYLVCDENEFRLFNANQSHRSFESCIEELNSLITYVKNNNVMEFDTAILSMEDKIFYPSHQLEYWSNKKYQPKCKVIKLEHSAHFPFFSLDDYTEILGL